VTWFHKHHFEPIATNDGTETYTEGGGRRPITIVLLKCHCYAFDTETLVGIWTLEQLQAKK
jgi:hypothetical protein